MTLQSLQLTPVLSPTKAEKFAGTFLTRADYDHVVEHSAIGKVGKETKFIFLRRALCDEGVEAAWRTLRRMRFGDIHNSHRTAFRRCHGGEIVMGYLGNRRTRPTEYFPVAYGGVIQPLCFQLEHLLAEYAECLPDGYCQRQDILAAANGRCLIGAELQSLVGEVGIRILQDDGRWRFFANADMFTTFFSTVTINNSVLSPAHRDSKNVSGYSCLTTYGRWTGGELCFPRLRVAFSLSPGDVLIADMQEQHGNVAPLLGRRVSVVAYLRAARA